MKCPNCGHEEDRDFDGKFCTQCGTRMIQDEVHPPEGNKKTISLKKEEEIPRQGESATPKQEEIPQQETTAAPKREEEAPPVNKKPTPEKSSEKTSFIQKLTPKRIARTALLLCMVCFIFPFLTISCSGEEYITVSGVELLTGFDMPTEHIDPNSAIVCAFGFALAAFAHTFLRQKHTLTAVCSAGSLICLVTFRLYIAQNFAEGGYNPDVVQVKYRLGWYAAILFGIIALFAPQICRYIREHYGHIDSGKMLDQKPPIKSGGVRQWVDKVGKSAETLARESVQAYIQIHGGRCTGIYYIKQNSGMQYSVSVREQYGETEMQSVYITEVKLTSAVVIGKMDGEVFVPF